MPPNPEKSRESFVPNSATLIAWEARAHMLAYRSSPHGTTQAEEANQKAHEAFGQLVRCTQEDVFGFIASRLGDDFHQAEDLCQNTYMRAYKGLPKFRGDRSQVQTWLKEIALNQLANYYGKKARRRLHEDPRNYGDNEYDEVVGRQMHVLQLVADDTVFKQMEESEITTRIQSAVSDLPPRLGVAMVLHYYRGMSHSQIGELLGITEEAAKVRVFRARKKMAPVLRDLIDKISS